MTIQELLVLVGNEAGVIILRVANLIVEDHWPGLLSAIFVALATIVGLWLWYRSHTYITAYRKALIIVRQSGSGADNLDLALIEEKLTAEKRAPLQKLAFSFSEFRETLLEIGRGDETKVRNAIRPSMFLNADDLGFSLRFYRFFPGLFVSSGLFLTFLGLVAVLSSTADLLPQGQNIDQTLTMNALRELLGKASAKFIISLMGLLCSIVLNIWLKYRVHKIESEAELLSTELEKKMDFISLEGLAERQLRAIEDQTADMKELNTRLIAELSEPLKRVSESSMENIGEMVGQLGDSLTKGLGGSLDTVSGRIEEIGDTLETISTSLKESSQQFDRALKASTTAFDESVNKLEKASEQLIAASGTISEATPALLDTIKETNRYSLKIAEGSVEMVNAAKATISQEKETVTDALTAVRELIRSFESRAKAYDGQLEKAFKTYQDEVAKTIDRLEQHSAGVQDRFADALNMLQTVIENAKAFEPESIQKSTDQEANSEAES